MRKVVLGGTLIVALILSSLYIANSLLLHHVYDLGPQLTYQPQVTLNQNPSSMQIPNSVGPSVSPQTYPGSNPGDVQYRQGATDVSFPHSTLQSIGTKTDQSRSLSGQSANTSKKSHCLTQLAANLNLAASTAAPTSGPDSASSNHRLAISNLTSADPQIIVGVI